MAIPEIRSIEFFGEHGPADDNVDVQVKLVDGTSSAFVVATPKEPAATMGREGSDFRFGTPVLYVRALDKDAVQDGVQALAREMGGYWLRYYNSLGDLSSKAKEAKLKRPKR